MYNHETENEIYEGLAELHAWADNLDDANAELQEAATYGEYCDAECDCEDCTRDDYENDGQPDEYTEWQDYMGGDDWDHGQFDYDYDY